MWAAGSGGDIKKCKVERLTGLYTAADWELASKYDKTSENTAADIINLPATPSIAGLYADGSHIGYHDGSAWKAYIQNDGKFYFKGDDTNFVQWDGATLSVRGALNADDLGANSITADKYNELRNTYVFNGDDSLDASFPFELDFEIVSEMTAIIMLNYLLGLVNLGLILLRRQVVVQFQVQVVVLLLRQVLAVA